MNKTQKLFTQIATIMAPPPELTVSEWADNYRFLSAESSAEPGKWNTDRAPYQREIMNAVNDPETETIAVMTSSQVGKTEIINNIIGYYVAYDPAPMLLVQPTEAMAQAYSKDRLAPMIRDTPVLTDKISEVKAKDSSNTQSHKKFPGGHISLVGANAPSSLASRPIRILLADEVDRFPVSAGNEGDPLSLAAKRTKTFWNKKKIYVSTPTVKEASRIESEYQDSTQEQWCLSCPSCGYFQPLRWAQIRFEDVTMECKYCKENHTEIEWKDRPGEWIAGADHNGKRGFHLNALASPWETWGNIISDFKDAKARGKDVLKTWVNTSLGESWEDDTPDVEEEMLMKRRERYHAELPKGVLLLTAAVDVQDDRLEVEVVGWGAGKESWGITYQQFYGEPDQEALWNQLDGLLTKEFSFENGMKLGISCTCIDSGGHFTSQVYAFCKPRQYRRVFAIKGKGGMGVPFIAKPTRNNVYKAALFTLGVDSGKETVINRLKVDHEGSPGYCHFPVNEETGYDASYFEGITAEKRVVKYYKGRPKVEWQKKSSVPNEPLDLRNYATAALEILNPDLEKMKENDQSGAVFKQTRKRGRRRMSKGVR